MAHVEENPDSAEGTREGSRPGHRHGKSRHRPCPDRALQRPPLLVQCHPRGDRLSPGDSHSSPHLAGQAFAVVFVPPLRSLLAAASQTSSPLGLGLQSPQRLLSSRGGGERERERKKAGGGGGVSSRWSELKLLPPPPSLARSAPTAHFQPEK